MNRTASFGVGENSSFTPLGISLNQIFTCSGINSSTGPWSPINNRVRFSTLNPDIGYRPQPVYILVNWSNITEAHTIFFRHFWNDIYQPQLDNALGISDPASQGFSSWLWWSMWVSIINAGEGNWKTQIFTDGNLTATQFWSVKNVRVTTTVRNDGSWLAFGLGQSIRVANTGEVIDLPFQSMFLDAGQTANVEKRWAFPDNFNSWLDGRSSAWEQLGPPLIEPRLSDTGWINQLLNVF